MDPSFLIYKSPSKRVVLGNLNNNENSPLSPMANLKLLTKVAASCVSDNTQVMINEGGVSCKGNRRLRSLSYICQKFLTMYNLNITYGECKVISLGNLASTLGIEKRRVYDIINVVASLKMAVKVCKDKYKWYGTQNLSKHLSDLKIYAIQYNLRNQVDQVLKYQHNNNCVDDCDYCACIPKFSSDLDRPDDNRIGRLCQKFIMMFLVADEIALSLNSIGKLILSKEQGKTGMRRLYDVANVLETLGLIKRHGKIQKKPSFAYCGPKIEINESDLANRYVSSVIQNIDYCDSSSESSSDNTSFRKIDSMLEVVCTELEKFDDGPKAKRKLCLDDCKNTEVMEIKTEIKDKMPFPSSPVSFIKAPTQSFRFVCNRITEKPDDFLSNHARTRSPHKSLTISEIKGSSMIFAGRNDESVPVKIQQPIKIIQPIRKLFPTIQNGAIYRAVKNGNVIKLVKM